MGPPRNGQRRFTLGQVVAVLTVEHMRGPMRATILEQVPDLVDHEQVHWISLVRGPHGPLVGWGAEPIDALEDLGDWESRADLVQLIGRGRRAGADRPAHRPARGGRSMTRRMSVALTLEQVRARTKTVTRRHESTWSDLKVGDHLLLIEKGMGLPKGAKQVVVCEVEITDVCLEPLGLVDDAQLVAEGFPGQDPGLWRCWWAGSHGYKLDPRAEDVDEVLAWVDRIICRRIEWRYLDA